MPHPSLGFPPADPTAGLPEAAALLRANRSRLGEVALRQTIALSPGFEERYSKDQLRYFLRDYDQHIEQLARALETGRDSYVVLYGEWLVPMYRRWHVSMGDFMALLAGLRDAIGSVLSPDDNQAAQELFDRWDERLKKHGRLPGDHQGNPVIRFFWKGAGIGDDKWV